MTKSLRLRQYLAECGKELTPAEAQVLADEIEGLLAWVTPEVAAEVAAMDIDAEVKDLVAYILRLKSGGQS